MTIMSLLGQIANEEIVLPAIQRDFVWDEDKTEKLLDSILRGYPIGLALLWETYSDIQFRGFTRDFRSGHLYAYRDNPERRRLKLVLDGQQRLQSLFIALYGTREGKRVYFDLLSGEQSDDVAEDRFFFYFLNDDEVARRHQAAQAAATEPSDTRRPEDVEWLIPVGDIVRLGAREKRELSRVLGADLHLTDEELLRLELNLALFDDVLAKDSNILLVSVIDEGRPADSATRKSEADVLEIFVRINREGVPLSRSDLIFSLLKLNWRESAEALPEFVQAINEGNSFAIDEDFVIRCLFAVSDLGSRMDLDVLRRRSNVQTLQRNFSQCCDAIRSTVDFVVTEGHCSSSTLLGGANTLVPFVYYMFHAHGHTVANEHLDRVKSALYLFALAKPFSRYADSRIGAFIRAELQPRLRAGDEEFPLEAAVSLVRRWERVSSIEALAQRNYQLAHHLVQGLTGARVQYHRNLPEIDHIFPRAELRRRGVSENLINHFANFWILAQGKNRNKSDTAPSVYFADVSDQQLQRARIRRELLEYEHFDEFLKVRAQRISREMSKRLQLTDRDLADAS
jgi:hypothetical protein